MKKNILILSQEAIVKCQEKEKTDLKKMRERLKEKTDECSELETQLLVSFDFLNIVWLAAW